jgi:protocatechuate 3,4-dioxygenase, beta subunit
MKYFLMIPVICLCISGCAQGESKTRSQDRNIKVGGSCEGCEAIHETPIPFGQLNWVDTLPGFTESGPKLEISGTVYQRDGRTPAQDVVIYIYHTDQQGLYSTKGNETGWGKRHGYLRGWVKTNEKGHYKFYTIRPASYPNSNNPQHIHPTIKEPGYNEYFIDEFVFADDPLLTSDQMKHAQKRGGSGILKPRLVNGIWIAKRDIVLGLNIPGYPADPGSN